MSFCNLGGNVFEKQLHYDNSVMVSYSAVLSQEDLNSIFFQVENLIADIDKNICYPKPTYHHILIICKKHSISVVQEHKHQEKVQSRQSTSTVEVNSSKKKSVRVLSETHTKFQFIQIIGSEPTYSFNPCNSVNWVFP